MRVLKASNLPDAGFECHTSIIFMCFIQNLMRIELSVPVVIPALQPTYFQSFLFQACLWQQSTFVHIQFEGPLPV